MTKNEIVRELSKCSPCRIRSLFVVYHNPSSSVKYCFTYDNDPFFGVPPLNACRELVDVILSAYKLRRYIKAIHVSYFSSSDGECIIRSFDSDRYVYTISDFIKTLNK